MEDLWPSRVLRVKPREAEPRRPRARREPGPDPLLPGAPFLKPTLAPLGGKGTLLSPEPHLGLLDSRQVFTSPSPDHTQQHLNKQEGAEA